MKYVNSLIELVGNTPLVKLSRVTGDVRSLVLAKVEYFNPGGSVKDQETIDLVNRRAAAMVLTGQRHFKH